jgi:hypothetical protein
MTDSLLKQLLHLIWLNENYDTATDSLRLHRMDFQHEFFHFAEHLQSLVMREWKASIAENSFELMWLYYVTTAEFVLLGFNHRKVTCWLQCPRSENDLWDFTAKPIYDYCWVQEYVLQTAILHLHRIRKDKLSVLWWKCQNVHEIS